MAGSLSRRPHGRARPNHNAQSFTLRASLLAHVLPYRRALDDGALLRARTTVPRNIQIQSDRFKKLCGDCGTNMPSRAHQPLRKRSTENSPKGERPRPWAMAGHSSSKKQASIRAGILAPIATSGLPPPCGQVRQSKKWLRLTGQPKPSRVPTKVDAPNVGATRT